MLLKSGKSKQTFLMNVLSLGFADLLIYFTSIVYLTFRFINGINNIVSCMYIYVVTVSTLSSQFHLVSIAIQRLIAVKYPLQCQRYLTQRRCAIALAFIWLLSLILPAILLSYNTEITCISSISCALILVLSYTYTSVCVLRRKKLATTRNSSGMSVLCFSVAITFAFLAFTLPFVVVAVTKKTETLEYFVTLCLFWLNPLLDPVLYFLFNAFKSSKQCCCHSKRRRVNQISINVSGSVRLAVINKGVSKD